jgi:hypothetical protein
MCDPLGCLYQDFVASNVDQFISFNLSLKEYFQSSMPILTHEQFDYPQFHGCDATLYMSYNPEREQETVSEILTKGYYERVVKPQLDQIEQWENRNWFDKYCNFPRYMRERCCRKKNIQQVQ